MPTRAIKAIFFTRFHHEKGAHQIVAFRRVPRRRSFFLRTRASQPANPSIAQAPAFSTRSPRAA